MPESRDRSPHPALPGLIDDLYRTVAEPGEWPTFLRHLATALDGVMPGMAVGAPIPRALAIDCPERQVRMFETRYAPRIQDLARRESLFGTWCYTDVESPVVEELMHDWARPLGVADCLSAHFLPDGVMAGFGVYRELGDPPFAPRDRALVEALAPHAQRAIELERRVGAAEGSRDLLAAALDRTTLAVCLLAADGTVLEMSAAARPIVRGGDGLHVTGGRLRATERVTAARLEGLVRETVATGSGRGLGAGGWLLVPRPSGRRAFELHATPLPRDGLRVGSTRACAALFLADPERRADTLPSRLVELHGLTPAEARLAARLAQGRSLAEVAGALDVSEHTLRNQLKSICAKTGTRRQGELVALLLRGIASQVADPPAD